MAQPEKKPAAALPFANLAVLVAFIGGMALYMRPLTSGRPNVETVRDTQGWGPRSVEARLWQDPLAVISKHAGEIGADAGGGPESEWTDAGVRAVSGRLIQGGPHHVLAVMVRAGSYEEAAESRLRVRHAVVEGLSASGFAPEDYLHIGYLKVGGWRDAEDAQPDDGDAKLIPASECAADPRFAGMRERGRDLLVPYEWYAPTTTAHTAGTTADSPAAVSDLVVLWLRDDFFTRRPLEGLGSLLRDLGIPPAHRDESNQVRVSIIGPSSSNGLWTMLREETEAYTKPFLAGVDMYSAFASVPERELLAQADIHPANGATAAEVLAGRLPYFRLRRTIPTDDQVMAALVGELRRRQVWEHGPSGHIAILAELDSVYGRSLRETFVEAFRVSLGVATSGEEQAKISRAIDTYYYLQGIDGKVPTDDKNDKRVEPASDQHAELRPREATEGTDQSDYIRRLADSLRFEDRTQRQRGEPGIVAVGLLGADVFDKITILRALRKALPDAVFFTNNIDARLGHPNEWDATHNLVIASPYGLAVDLPGSSIHYPPFRDSYEASAFAATLAATGQAIPPGQPHLYEIGLAGPYALDSAPDNGVRTWMQGRWPLLLLALLSGGALMCYVTATRGKENGWFALPSRADFFREPPLFLFGAFVVVGGMLGLAQCLSCAGGEPVAMLDGISIWPSEAVRLLAGLLGVVFLAKSMIEIKANDSRLAARFHLPTPVEGSPADTPEDLQVVTHLWARYVRNGRWRERFGRVLRPALLFYALGLSLVLMLGAPRLPGRGDVSWWADMLITKVFTVPVTIFLLFFVIDAMVLNRRFIAQLMAATRWPQKLVREYSGTIDVDGEVETCIVNRLAIDLIAARTEVIGRLIYYPFILLALMMLSRLSYFDDWDLPVGLLVVFGMNAAGAVFAARTLRRSAERARQTALQHLQRIVFRASVGGETPEQQQRLAAAHRAIEEIEAVRTGAFGPFSDNPLVGALLLPGGAGLVALAQYLPLTK
jgi:hypothetical protein